MIHSKKKPIKIIIRHKFQIMTKFKYPLEHVFEYKASTGTLQFYHNRKRHDLGDLFSLFVVGEVCEISGWNTALHSHLSSNFFRSAKDDYIYVRYRKDGKSEVIYKGNYQQIKPQLTAGGKYTRLLICLMPSRKDRTELIKVGIRFTGSAGGDLGDFMQQHDMNVGQLMVLNCKGTQVPPKDKRKGYYKPAFLITGSGVNGFAYSQEEVAAVTQSPFYKEFFEQVHGYIKQSIVDIDTVNQGPPAAAPTVQPLQQPLQQGVQTAAPNTAGGTTLPNADEVIPPVKVKLEEHDDDLPF